MAQADMEELKIGPQGRVVIPATMRKALGIEPGAVLVGHVEDGRLVLERREAILDRLQARFANVVPRDVSLADEVVTERRQEAAREATDR
jgi:AbrB family looped-hinge helix DNA binding protein